MTYYRARRIVAEEMPVDILSIVLGTLGGILLNTRVESFIAIPVLLSFIPVINGVGGNILSIFGSRLGSALHLGSVRGFDREMRKSIRVFVVISVLVFTAMALTIYFTNSYFYSEALAMKIIILPVLAGFMLVGSLLPMTVIIALTAFRLGMDPDNVVVPLITTIADLAGVVFLLLAMIMVGI